MDMANHLCYKEEEIASVKLSPAKLNSLRAPYRYAAQGKVLFKKIRIDHLYNHLIRIWSVEGTLKIHELANDFFVIVFSDPLDFLKAFQDGPWMIAGHYITLQPFAFNFKPLEATITTTPIWIRLPDFPVELYDTEVFRLIAEALGGFLVKTHGVTEERVKMKFAQICVEVDVSKPLRSCVEIGGLMQRIEYVGLYLRCGLCRRAGHLTEDCPLYRLQPQPKPDLPSVPFIESLYSDGSSGSSSDLIREASTRYLQHGEGTSSSLPQSPEFQANSSEINSIAKKPLENEPTTAVQTAHLNPFSPPFQLRKIEADHKVINAKSILLMEQSKEPVILSTTEEVSSIHASLSISPLTSGKAWIKMTPNVPDQNVHSVPRKLLCWTCGGADDTKVAKDIDELIATHNPSIVFLSQMSNAGLQTYKVISDSRFSGSFFVNPVGYMGGMWLLWRKEEIKVDIETATLTHIKATIHLSGEGQV